MRRDSRGRRHPASPATVFAALARLSAQRSTAVPAVAGRRGCGSGSPPPAGRDALPSDSTSDIHHPDPTLRRT